MSEPIITEPAMIGTYLKRVPLGSVGEPEDIAAIVQFLATDEAAYLTGQVIDVDGGWGATAPSIFAAWVWLPAAWSRASTPDTAPPTCSPVR